MTRSDLAAAVGEAIHRYQFREPGASARELAAVAIAAIAQSKDWHIISSADVKREDDPPVPDRMLEQATRFGTREPQQITTVRVELDGEVITAHGTISRYMLAHSPVAYQQHADARLGHDFLAMLGYRLGVPGCEDVPERLAKAGHP